jgi:hypothetical protein
MQYALLIYETAADFGRRDQNGDDSTYVGAWRAYYKAVVEAGIYPASFRWTRRKRARPCGGEMANPLVQDGPYASSKEQLGGFVLLELPSLDAALEWAARCPVASYGVVEIRPVAPEILRRVTSEDQRR